MNKKKPKEKIWSAWNYVWISLIALFVLGMGFVTLIYPHVKGPDLEISVTELRQSIENDKVKSLTITVESSWIKGTLVSGIPFQSRSVNTAEIEKLAAAKDVTVRVERASIWRSWITWFVLGTSLLVLSNLGLFFWMNRRDRRFADAAKKDMMLVERPKQTFKDIAGYEEVKEETFEIIDFLKHPEKYADADAKIPRGVLFIGPPGTGKTLHAKAIAGECGVAFIEKAGSDFVEQYVGTGAKRVRELFKVAKENAPCIIFLDDIDVVAQKRAGMIFSAEGESNQTIGAFLHEMDGFNTDDQVIVMGATNRPEVLDPAIVRPGRLDRKIFVNLPNCEEREQILKIHTRNKKLAPEVNLAAVAKMTGMFSGADLATMMNEAAILQVRHGKEAIGLAEVNESVEKIYWGPSKKKNTTVERDKKLTAYHEAGHTLAAVLIPGADRPHKVTILGRGGSGGATSFTPEEERMIRERDAMLAEIAVGFGGKAAELIVFNTVTTGPRGDMMHITNTVKKMVCEYGMTDVGLASYGESSQIFGMDVMSQQLPCSEWKKKQIDEEVEKLLKTQYEIVCELFRKPEHRIKLDYLARALLIREVLNGDEIAAAIKQAEIQYQKQSAKAPG